MIGIATGKKIEKSKSQDSGTMYFQSQNLTNLLKGTQNGQISKIPTPKDHLVKGYRRRRSWLCWPKKFPRFSFFK